MVIVTGVRYAFTVRLSSNLFIAIFLQFFSFSNLILEYLNPIREGEVITHDRHMLETSNLV